MWNRSQVENIARLSAPILTAYVRTASAAASQSDTLAEAMDWLEREARRAAENLTARDQSAFLKQVEHVRGFLARHVAHERTLVIFAGPDCWETIPLQQELPAELHWGKPALTPLFWLAAEEKPCGVAVVDRAGARFFRHWMGELEEVHQRTFEIDTSGWKRKEFGHSTQEGGGNARGDQRDDFEKRIANQYAALMRDVARDAAEFCQTRGLTALFVVASGRLLRMIKAAIPLQFRRPVIFVDLDLGGAAPRSVEEHVGSKIEAWLRKQEEALVAQLFSAKRDTVIGIEEALARLQEGRVRCLLVARGLQVELNRCRACARIDRSADPRCPACGGEREPMALRDALPDLVKDARVDMVLVGGAAAQRLKDEGGMAGWVRRSKGPAWREKEAPGYAVELQT